MHTYRTTRSLVLSRWLLLLLMGIGFSLSIQAQSLPIPDNVTNEFVLKRDTTRGIHHLFRARRIGGVVNIGLGLYALSAGIRLTDAGVIGGSANNGTYSFNSPSRSPSFPTYVLSSLPGSLIVSVGISKLIRFEKKKEIDLLAAYERGTPLPAEIQRRLNGRHLVSSAQLKPATIPILSDTLINPSAVAAESLASASGVVPDTLNTPVSKPVLMTVAAILHSDTVRAIHRLFSRRQGGSAGNIVLGILSIGSGIVMAKLVRDVSNGFLAALGTIGSFGSSTRYTPATSPTGLSFSWPGILIAGLGIAKGIRFSQNREYILIDAYENGVPLPAKIKRNLEPKFFNQRKTTVASGSRSACYRFKAIPGNTFTNTLQLEAGLGPCSKKV
ncbi:hypothetical protein [Spirosoma aerophilum]